MSDQITISDRLSVEGPTPEGFYKLTIRQANRPTGRISTHYIDSDEAAALIAALTAREAASVSAAGAPRCPIRKSSADPQQECDWPLCGCDAHATRVIDALIDLGWTKAKASSPPSPSGTEGASLPAFDFLAHLRRQREFSERTFGPGARTAGVVDHIRKELCEIETKPDDLSEWIDVVILALDGAWRAGHSPDAILAALVGKQTRNEARTWPDWRTAPADKAIEHVRASLVPEGAAPPANRVQAVMEATQPFAAYLKCCRPLKASEEIRLIAGQFARDCLALIAAVDQLHEIIEIAPGASDPPGPAPAPQEPTTND